MPIDSGLPEGPCCKQPWWREHNYLASSDEPRQDVLFVAGLTPSSSTINIALLQMLREMTVWPDLHSKALPPLWYHLQTLENAAFFADDDKQCFGKCSGRINLLPSSPIRIMLQMHKAKDITLCMRGTAVRKCNFIESPSGFVFIYAFVEQGVSPGCVEGWSRCCFEWVHFAFSWRK